MENVISFEGPMLDYGLPHVALSCVGISENVQVSFLLSTTVKNIVIYTVLKRNLGK